MALNDGELVEDVYREIFSWIADHYETVTSWFLVSKMFQHMIHPSLLRFHSQPRALRCHTRWDGFQGGIGSFRGKEVVVWRVSDYESVPPREYPHDVWQAILHHTGSEWDDLQTKECEISFEGYDDDSGRLAWVVRDKRRYVLYGRPDFDRDKVNWRDYKANRYETDYQRVEEFFEDEINWGPHGAN
jgi:hypothetical protein